MERTEIYYLKYEAEHIVNNYGLQYGDLPPSNITELTILLKGLFSHNTRHKRNLLDAYYEILSNVVAEKTGRAVSYDKGGNLVSFGDVQCQNMDELEAVMLNKN